VPVSLDDVFNARRVDLPEGLRAPARFVDACGSQTIRGMPFAFGGREGPDVVLLEGDEVSIELGGVRATYVLFVHVVENVVTKYLDGVADDRVTGMDLGELVSEYDLVGAIELAHPNPFHPGIGPLNAYGIADWYRYLNLGYHVPIVGGSDKMTATGPARRHPHLRPTRRSHADLRELDGRDSRREHVRDRRAAGDDARRGRRAGRPASAAADGRDRAGRVGGRVGADADRSRRGDRRRAGGRRDERRWWLSARGRAAIPVARSSWIALRVRGSYHAQPDDIATHTSVVQVLVEGSELFSEHDSMTVLDQIQGAIAYVDTIATRPDARRFRQLRVTLETAYNRLHQRMHAAGIYHRHPLHDPAEPHEH
jgi:hypothetical protein